MNRSPSAGFRFQLLLVLIPWTAAVPVVGASGAPAGSPSVTLTERSDDFYSIEGKFQVQGSSSDVWRVLSDYDRIGEFVSSIETSKVVERRPNVILLRQTSRNGVWVLRRRFEVLLEVRENAGRSIEFKDIGKTSFEDYAGSWVIETKAGETWVTYRLDAKIVSGLPGFLSRKIMRTNIERLLTETLEEIHRVKERS